MSAVSSLLAPARLRAIDAALGEGRRPPRWFHALARLLGSFLSHASPALPDLNILLPMSIPIILICGTMRRPRLLDAPPEPCRVCGGMSSVFLVASDVRYCFFWIPLCRVSTTPPEAVCSHCGTRMSAGVLAMTRAAPLTADEGAPAATAAARAVHDEQNGQPGASQALAQQQNER